MRSLEEIIVLNANASGISVEENLRLARSGQFIKRDGCRDIAATKSFPQPTVQSNHAKAEVAHAE